MKISIFIALRKFYNKKPQDGIVVAKILTEKLGWASILSSHNEEEHIWLNIFRVLSCWGHHVSFYIKGEKSCHDQDSCNPSHPSHLPQISDCLPAPRSTLCIVCFFRVNQRYNNASRRSVNNGRGSYVLIISFVPWQLSIWKNISCWLDFFFFIRSVWTSMHCFSSFHYNTALRSVIPPSEPKGQQT